MILIAPNLSIVRYVRDVRLCAAVMCDILGMGKR